MIGSRFDLDLLTALGVEPVVADLVAAELIDQVRFTRQPEYVFHHPLIRAVAYESQLKSDRAELHRRLAAAIEAREPGSVDENAALIAEHLEAAGDLHAAFDWHMRAGDVVDQPRHRRGVAELGAGTPGRRRACPPTTRTAPRCASLRAPCCAAPPGESMWTSPATVFDELRELCAAAGDKASLAIGMAGLLGEHLMRGRVPRGIAAGLRTHGADRVDRRPDLDGRAVPRRRSPKIETGEMAEVLRWSQTVIDLADGDPTKGNFILGSPLAVALASRGIARWALGRPGWRDDLDEAVAMARSTDPMSHALVITCKYGSGDSGRGAAGRRRRAARDRRGAADRRAIE